MKAYFIHLAVAGPDDATDLATQLAGASIVEQCDNRLWVLWPAWGAGVGPDGVERALDELALVLRRWANGDGPRELTVLDERPVEVAEQLFARAA